MWYPFITMLINFDIVPFQTATLSHWFENSGANVQRRLSYVLVKMRLSHAVFLAGPHSTVNPKHIRMPTRSGTR